MATVEISSTVEKEGDISKEASDNSRANSAEFNDNIQNGGDAVTISSLQQDTFGVVISEVTAPQVGKWSDFAMISTQDFPSHLFFQLLKMLN